MSQPGLDHASTRRRASPDLTRTVLGAPIAEALERFLSHDAEQLTREDALLLRRARGFGLVGLALIATAGAIPAALNSHAPILIACVLLGLEIGVGMFFMARSNGRYLRILTHVALGAALGVIAVAAGYLGNASPVSTIFSSILIVTTCYILGVRAALGWTAAALVTMSVLVLGADAPPTPPGGVAISIASIHFTNCIALIGICGVAVAGRRFADAQSDELDFLASHDSLTGLLNRRVFEERLTQSLARARRHQRRVGIVFLDLDDFKKVNDTYGHAMGDAVLRAAASRIDAVTRETDSACRIGGDEFVILVEEFDEEKSMDVFVERLRQGLLNSIEVSGHSVTCGASAGVACYPADGDDPETLLLAADHAMYAVKSARRRIEA